MMDEGKDQTVMARKRRILGLFVWGLILALLLSLTLNVSISVVRAAWHTPDSASATLEGILGWFVVFAIPMFIIAVLTGIFTSAPKHFWKPALFIFPVVAFGYIYCLYLLYYAPLGSTPRPLTQDFWHPAYVAVTAMVSGILIGSVASLAYWQAGRTKR